MTRVMNLITVSLGSFLVLMATTLHVGRSELERQL